MDVNRAQNHLVELKIAAVCGLARETAIAFLGGQDMPGRRRIELYRTLRPRLTDAARAYWDARSTSVARGAINAGVSERFIRLVCWFVRHVVQTPSRVERLLACRSLEEQQDLFTREWDTRRWRWMFTVLLNRWSMSRAFDPRFFAQRRADELRRTFPARSRAMRSPRSRSPTTTSCTTCSWGGIRIEQPEGVPPYLGARGCGVIAGGTGSLLLVDGGMTDHLRTLPDRSVNAFALSNICEWLSEAEIPALFREVERVAAPGARLVFRNFVGWTDLPGGSTRLEEDRQLGAALIREDRSALQPRVVVCRVSGP